MAPELPVLHCVSSSSHMDCEPSRQITNELAMVGEGSTMRQGMVVAGYSDTSANKKKIRVASPSPLASHSIDTWPSMRAVSRRLMPSSITLHRAMLCCLCCAAACLLARVRATETKETEEEEIRC